MAKCNCVGKRIPELNTQATYDGDLSFAGDKAGLVEALQVANKFLGPWVSSGSDISYTVGNVGIGTTSPSTLLHLQGAGTAPELLIEDTGNNTPALTLDGNRASQDQELGKLVGRWNGNETGRIAFTAGPDTGNKDDGKIVFLTAAPGGALTQAMLINEEQNVGIGATSGPTAGGGKVLFFGDNAADPTMSANTAGFYGKDVAGTVEAFAIDEAGNAAQLTPHNFSLFTPDSSFGYPWSYFSKNRYIGKEINVDMFKLARAVENLTGEQIIYLRDLPAEDKLDWNENQDDELEKSLARREQQQANDQPVEELYIKKPMPDWMRNLSD